MLSTEEAPADPSRPWWTLSVGLFAAGVLSILAWIVLANSGAQRFGTVAPQTLNGAAFALTRGSGHPAGSSFILESAQDGLVSLSAEVQPFAAEKYPRVEWDLSSVDPPSELAFAWRTRENPRRTYSKPLFWLGGRIRPLQLDQNDGWRGTITGVALVARGAMTAPLEVRALRLTSTTAGATLAETFEQWADRFPLKVSAVAFPFDAERGHFMPIAKAMAIACGLAIIVYIGFARVRKRQVDWRVPWAIFAIGWILLDLRWQIDLGREVRDAAQRYWGRPSEEKPLAADDAPLAALAQELRHALPPPPVRIYVLSDNNVIATRITHRLFPYNVSRNALPRDEQVEHVRIGPPNRERVRSGDYLALIFFTGLRYDANTGQLVWPDGGTRAAEIVVAKPETLLVRIK